jgi:hypothetical protein
MTLAYALCYFLYLMMFVTLILSFYFCFKEYNPGYLRFFPFYHLIACLTEGVANIYFLKKSFPLVLTQNIPYNFFSLIEFMFFTFFLSKQITEKKNKLLLYIGAGLSCTILVFLFFKNQTFNYPNWNCTIPINIFYIAGCLLYFHNIFFKLSHANLSKEPSFWIITGILFYSVIETPTLFFAMHVNSPSFSIFTYIIINGIAYTLLHSLFIKAYTCRISR